MFNKTAIAVVVFIIVLITAGYSMKSNADSNFHIGVGNTVVNSNLKVGEIGFTHNNWDFEAALIEDGETDKGIQDVVPVYSASYITTPGWTFYGIDPYFKLGVSYNEGSPLVGNTNFRLGVGFDFHDIWKFEYAHHSSAGIHNPNTGIDYLKVSYKFDPFWKQP